MLNTLLFAALPYVSLTLLVVGGIYRYRKTGFTVSSLSSQFLESNRLYWGAVAFHYGILTLLVGHLLGLFFPQTIVALTRPPVGRFIIEMIALTAGLLSLVGLVMLIVRRLLSDKALAVTSKMDYVVYLLLLSQIIAGLWIALGHRWGSAWYVVTAVPYLKSIFLFQPDVKMIATMPPGSFFIKFHVVGAWVIVGLVPFSRLMHILVAPFPFFWRAVQIAIWNRKSGGANAGSIKALR